VTSVRLALANVRYPNTPGESIELAARAIQGAAAGGASIVCFPECYVPGYRGLGKMPPPPDEVFLEHAWRSIQDEAATAGVTVILGTERIADGALRISTLIINADGSRAGFQDKVQLDPGEESAYARGHGRRVFTAGALTFGVVICHEGWRYPETVRWAVQHGAQVVFHPHFDLADPGTARPRTFADPTNTFHEKAALCRAAENTCYFASVNYASEHSATTSAVVAPDGHVIGWHPYGEDGLLFADVDLSLATGFLAHRCRTITSDV
jgi:predicted amidohydrolase